MDDQIEWNEAEHVTYWRGVPFIGPHAVLTGIFARLPQDFDNFSVEQYTDTWHFAQVTGITPQERAGT